MSSQQLLLSWKDHNGTLISVFDNLLKRNTLVDCTLAADGQYLKAHKVVLSACSNYFEMLFSQENEKNPIVILKDVKFQDLEAAVNFMYKGEVEVFEDRLGAFMEVADSLQIKGLGSYVKINDINEKSKPVDSSKASVLTKQQPRKDSFNTPGDSWNESSKFPVNSDQDINSENFSQHQQLWGESSCYPRPGSSPCLIPSTVSTTQQLPQSDKNNLAKNSSPIVLNTQSSCSVPSEVDAEIKTEPIAEVYLEDKCDEEYVGDAAMKDDVEEWSEQHGESIRDEHPTNRPELGYPGIQLQSEETTFHNTAGAQIAEHTSFEGSGCRKKSPAALLLAPALARSPPKYACHLCGKAFDAPALLERHFRSHTGERPFSCEQCGKAFMHKHVLLKHYRIHTGERPYSCDECGKAFTQMHVLQSHRRIHTGERPFSCEQCGKAFRHNNDLLVHRRIHTGERPYSCDLCGKAFTKMVNLKTHRRIHTGERPYRCDLCGSCWVYSGDLQKHKRRVHGATPARSAAPSEPQYQASPNT